MINILATFSMFVFFTLSYVTFVILLGWVLGISDNKELLGLHYYSLGMCYLPILNWLSEILWKK